MVEALKKAARRVLWTLKIPYLPEAIRAVVKGPYTTGFPYRGDADVANYRGATVWDPDVCIGCGACHQVCPSGAIEMWDDTESEPPMRRFRCDYGRCIFCGHCHFHCTTDDGVYQTTDWNLATYDRHDSFSTNEKELLVCGSCEQVIATKDHVSWVARKVGPKAWANPGLAITMEGALVSAPQPTTEPAEGNRANIMRVLCPHCRRVIVFDEIT